MSTTEGDKPANPFEFLQSLWGANPVPLPGFVTPTMDTEELAKRIADLKAVEGWLKLNLTMLQSTIQGLEVQQATIAALRAMPTNFGGDFANSVAEAMAKAANAGKSSTTKTTKSSKTKP